MLNDILELFTHYPQVGLLGIAGCEHMSKSGIWWEGIKRFGNVLEHRETYSFLTNDEVKNDMVQVEAIDGLMMITQYDIPWREDLFNLIIPRSLLRGNILSVLIPCSLLQGHSFTRIPRSSAAG